MYRWDFHARNEALFCREFGPRKRRNHLPRCYGQGVGMPVRNRVLYSSFSPYEKSPNTFVGVASTLAFPPMPIPKSISPYSTTLPASIGFPHDYARRFRLVEAVAKAIVSIISDICLEAEARVRTAWG